MAPRKRKKGQALVEYLLILVMVSVVSFTFLQYVFSDIFEPAMDSSALPKKMTECLSTGDSYGGC
jgi:hypothetical protein